MKRSEMITVLLDAINKNQYQDYYWVPHEAERVLSILEQAGMLPPKIGKVVIADYYNDKDEKLQYERFGYINEWEPEE